jgi:hypothetical protein
MLAEVGALKPLTLDWMQNVTSLPSFAPLQQLESVANGNDEGMQTLRAFPGGHKVHMEIKQIFPGVAA